MNTSRSTIAPSRKGRKRTTSKPTPAVPDPSHAPAAESAEQIRARMASPEHKEMLQARTDKLARAADANLLNALGEVAELMRIEEPCGFDDEGGWQRCALVGLLAGIARARQQVHALAPGATALPFGGPIDLEPEL